MKFARDHLSDPSLINTNRDISDIDNLDDIYLKGIEKFQSILQAEELNEGPSRFSLGVTSSGADVQKGSTLDREH